MGHKKIRYKWRKHWGKKTTTFYKQFFKSGAWLHVWKRATAYQELCYLSFGWSQQREPEGTETDTKSFNCFCPTSYLTEVNQVWKHLLFHCLVSTRLIINTHACARVEFHSSLFCPVASAPRETEAFVNAWEQDEVCVSTSKQVGEQRQKQDGFGPSVCAHVCYKYFETIPNAYTEEAKIPALLHHGCPAVTPPRVTIIYRLTVNSHICSGI